MNAYEGGMSPHHLLQGVHMLLPTSSNKTGGRMVPKTQNLYIGVDTVQRSGAVIKASVYLSE